jgi:hypothetical protein
MDETAETLNTGLDTTLSLDAGAHDAAGTAANASHTAEGHEPGDGDTGEGGEEGAVEFQFGDEASPASDEGQREQANAAPWIKELRKNYAASQRRIRELEAEKGTTQQQQQPSAPPTLGPRPKLEQFDYDEGKFDAALEKWYEDKREFDAAAEETKRVAEKRQQSIAERQRAYTTEATSLKLNNFRELEDEVVGALSVEQQGILLAGADRPALLVAALGRFPNKLKHLADIKDPVRFAFAAGKLEKELKVTNRSAAKPAPETRVSSASGASGGSEKKLEQLRTEAEKTGDYSRVHAYKRQLKAAQQRK